MTRQNAIPSGSNNNNNNTNNNNKADSVPEPAERVNGTTAEDDNEITQMPALIPFWDLANHVNGVVTTSYNLATEQIESTTLTDVKKGEQIFIHYGKRNNANLLVHNG